MIGLPDVEQVPSPGQHRSPFPHTGQLVGGVGAGGEGGGVGGLVGPGGVLGQLAK